LHDKHDTKKINYLTALVRDNKPVKYT